MQFIKNDGSDGFIYFDIPFKLKNETKKYGVRWHVQYKLYYLEINRTTRDQVEEMLNLLYFSESKGKNLFIKAPLTVYSNVFSRQANYMFLPRHDVINMFPEHVVNRNLFGF